jgi:hypothetical protein
VRLVKKTDEEGQVGCGRDLGKDKEFEEKREDRVKEAPFNNVAQ